MSDILRELRRSDFVLSDYEPEVANAIFSGQVPVRGRYQSRWHRYDAVDRIETLLHPTIRISFHGNSMDRWDRGRSKYEPGDEWMNVEADLNAVNKWISENVASQRGKAQAEEKPKPPQSKTRSQPQRNKAKQLLRKMFPGGIPSKDELPDKDLRAQCKGAEWNGISDDTIARAAAELRDG